MHHMTANLLETRTEEGSLSEFKHKPTDDETPLPLTVLFHLRAKQGEAGMLLAAFGSTTSWSWLRAREGLLDFTVHQATDEPTRFMGYETWASPEAFEKARFLPLPNDFVRGITPLLAGPIETTVWRSLGERPFSVLPGPGVPTTPPPPAPPFYPDPS